MKTQKNKNSADARNETRETAGFSLVELLVAMALFLIISSAAVRLVKAHVPLVTTEQNQAGLNMTIRNAVSQMQVDVVNAGTGYYPGANIPAFPVGITIWNCGDLTNGCNAMNQSGADCFNAQTFTYGQNCFDTLNVIASDPTIPPSHPSDQGSNCVSTTSSTLFAVPTGSTTMAQLAGAFHAGDNLLLIKSDGSQMTTTTLTKDGSVTGNKVQLQHNPTGADGSNADPFGIANPSDAANNKLGTTFCTTDWILKMAGITYSVNASNPADPQLVRTVNGANPQVVADQVIGFKVGAMTWNTNEDQVSYLFNAPAAPPNNGCTSNCGYQNDFARVRSVLVSLIGRTASDPAGNFHNNFDGGPYKVESASVVINPRNLSMNDQ